MRRKYDDTHVVLDEHGQPIDPLSQLSTDELNKQSSAALVGIDDAIKTSEQELGFAEAQFGKDATSEFAEVVKAGHVTIKEAFGLRQRLDDAEPETEPQKRQMTSEIIRLCMAVSESLDEQVEKFDELRDLQAKAPQVLDGDGAAGRRDPRSACPVPAPPSPSSPRPIPRPHSPRSTRTPTRPSR